MFRFIRCAVPRPVSALDANTDAGGRRVALGCAGYCGCRITSRTAGSSGISPLCSGPICTRANMPRTDVSCSRSRRRISSQVSSGRSLQPVGLVLGHPVDRGMRVVPVPGALVVQVGGLLRQQVQRGPEVAHRVAGRRHAEPDPRLLDPLVRRLQRRRRAEEDRPRDPPGDPPLPEVGRLASISAGVSDGPSMSVSITGLKLSSRYWVISDSTSSASSGTPPGMISGAGSSRSHSVWMTARHQPQHATRALEPLQGRPVLVQPVEQLRMDRVGGLDPLLIGRLGDPGGNSRAVPRVEVGEHPRDRGDIRLGGGAGLLEQPLPDDRERLDRAKRAATGRRSAGSPAAAGPAPPARSCPPTSMSVAPRSISSADGAADDAGIETTSIAPGTALTASVSVCANVNWVSNVPPARSSRP